MVVARQTRIFARSFGLQRLGFYAGLIHDIGKANPDFQQYLLDQIIGITSSATVPHSPWGAAMAIATLGRAKVDGPWVEPALIVLGHHSGLSARGVLGDGLEKAFKKVTAAATDDAKEITAFLADLPPAYPYKNELSAGPGSQQQEHRELLLRMVFSALVDADRLDTEAHFNPRRQRDRGRWWPLASLWPAFRRNQVAKTTGGRGTSRVNQVRREVYRQCLRAAKQQPGIFRLTVPTGGGKTRSALAFALKHAATHKSHGFCRVIFALPFTSIVDQTVREYESIFPGHVVLEHHSQIDLKDDENNQSEAERRRQLAEENWDAPLVITTTVQLFESLLSKKPGRCRKIHNIARSIIVLDEVQALPPHVLEPTLSVLRSLVERCGVTVVLCTATQPAFEETPYLKAFAGLEVKSIVPSADADRHFQRLKRVIYTRRLDKPTWIELAKELAGVGRQQSMVVLNTRRDAIKLIDSLRNANTEGLLHLSTLLCGAHRRSVLEEVRRRLKSGEPIRLITTQVVEAGVDIDFPVVYRAIAPLDRIIQAAGRCNREGRSSFGEVIIFEPAEGAMPRGPYKVGCEEAKAILGRYDAQRLHEPAICHEYFLKMFGNLNLDEHGIQALRREMNYPEVDHLYRMIEQDTLPTLIQDYDGKKARKMFKQHLAKPSRVTWRRLQPYLVNLYIHEAKKLLAIGSLTEHAGTSLLVWNGPYESKPPHRGAMGVLMDPSDLTTLTLEEAGWSI